MKKLFAGAVLGATMLIGPVGANGAIHFGPGCFTGASIGGHVFDYCFSDVVTPSGNANAHFTGDLLTPAPDKAVTIRGFGCQAAYPNGGFTTDTKITITPSGKVNGYCKLHP